MDNVPLSVVRLVVSCVDSEIKTMKKNKKTLKKLSLNKKVVSNLEGQQTTGGALTVQICPINTVLCPVGTWICPIETQLCPRETWVCPIDTKICPIESIACPTGTLACPY